MQNAMYVRCSSIWTCRISNICYCFPSGRHSWINQNKYSKFDMSKSMRFQGHKNQFKSAFMKPGTFAFFLLPHLKIVKPCNTNSNLLLIFQPITTHFFNLQSLQCCDWFKKWGETWLFRRTVLRWCNIEKSNALGLTHTNFGENINLSGIHLAVRFTAASCSIIIFSNLSANILPGVATLPPSWPTTGTRIWS